MVSKYDVRPFKGITTPLFHLRDYISGEVQMLSLTSKIFIHSVTWTYQFHSLLLISLKMDELQFPI